MCVCVIWYDICMCVYKKTCEYNIVWLCFSITNNRQEKIHFYEMIIIYDWIVSTIMQRNSKTILILFLSSLHNHVRNVVVRVTKIMTYTSIRLDLSHQKHLHSIFLMLFNCVLDSNSTYRITSWLFADAYLMASSEKKIPKITIHRAYYMTKDRRITLHSRDTYISTYDMRTS